MKRFLLALASVVAFASASHALDLNYSYHPDSNWTVEQGTVTISSTTAMVFDNPGVPFQVDLSTANATYYYVMGPTVVSTTTIPLIGWPVFNGSSTTITGAGLLQILFGPGGTAQTIRYKRVQP